MANPYVNPPGFPYYPYYNPQQQLYYPYVYGAYYGPQVPYPVPPGAIPPVQPPIDPSLLTGPLPAQPPQHPVIPINTRPQEPEVPKSPSASAPSGDEEEEDGAQDRFALHPVSYPPPLLNTSNDDDAGDNDDDNDEDEYDGPGATRSTRSRGKQRVSPYQKPKPSPNLAHVTGAPKQDDAGAVSASEVAKFASPVRTLPHVDLEIFPSRGVFENILYTYQSNLSARKRNKALISRSAYAEIQATLVEIKESRCRRGTAQFRFWVKKMFGLIDFYGHEVVGHQGKPVAIREDIYDILVHCHDQCEHGGRDRTVEVVKDFYRWIPKVIIGEFVKHCPGCSVKRATVKSETSKMALYDLGDMDQMAQMESMEQDDDDDGDGDEEGHAGLASVLDGGPNGGPGNNAFAGNQGVVVGVGGEP